MTVHYSHKILRIHDVVTKTGLSRSTIYARVAAGNFPLQFPIGSWSCVGWLESDIDQYIDVLIGSSHGANSRRRPRFSPIGDDSGTPDVSFLEVGD
jgi:prophage regulatory protein